LANVKEERKQIVSKLKTMVNTKRQWDAFCSYVDILIAEQHKLLEQSLVTTEIYRAQGAITSLKKLKQLRDEAKD
jgi:hypothetical protein